MLRSVTTAMSRVCDIWSCTDQQNMVIEAAWCKRLVLTNHNKNVHDDNPLWRHHLRSHEECFVRFGESLFSVRCDPCQRTNSIFVRFTRETMAVRPATCWLRQYRINMCSTLRFSCGFLKRHGSNQSWEFEKHGIVHSKANNTILRQPSPLKISLQCIYSQPKKSVPRVISECLMQCTRHCWS